MRGRKPEPFVLKPQDEQALHELLQDGQTPWRVARRAQILLSRAAPAPRVGLVSAQVELDRTTVWRVCERYQNAGLEAALYDAPRVGHPRVFSRTYTQAH